MSRQQRIRIKHCHAALQPDEVRALLSQLCTRFGFCLPPVEIEKLAASPPTDIDGFAAAALVAEGYGFTKADPLCIQARELVAQAFMRHQSRNTD